MAPKFVLFTKGSKFPLNKGFKNMFELLQSCAQPSIYDLPPRWLLLVVDIGGGPGGCMLLKLAKLGELELWDSLLGINSDIIGLAPCKWRMGNQCLKLNAKSASSDLSSLTYDLHVYLTLKMPRKPASENLSVYVVCWIFLQTFQTYFCIQANSVAPDQAAPRGAVWSGSTLFAKMTFKITSRWQSRRQFLWLAV